MTTSKKLSLKEINPLSYMVATMYETRAFCFGSMKRKFSRRLKIHHSNFSQHVRITNKETGNYASFTYEYCLNGTVRICVKHTQLHKNRMEYGFSVTSNKELLQKLINYNLIE